MAVVVQVQSLAWELSHAIGAAKKKKDFYRQKGAKTKKLYEAKQWVGYFVITLL